MHIHALQWIKERVFPMNSGVWRRRCLLGLVSFLFATSLFVAHNVLDAAEPPNILTYQGKLLQNNVSVSSTVNMHFVLYDAATAGNAVYTASGTLGATSSIPVSVVSGLFSVDFGGSGTNSLDPDIFSTNELWLEVTIDGTVLTPRKRLTSVPYAVNAARLAGAFATSTPTSTAYIPIASSDGSFSFNTTTVTELFALGDAYILGDANISRDANITRDVNITGSLAAMNSTFRIQSTTGYTGLFLGNFFDTGSVLALTGPTTNRPVFTMISDGDNWASLVVTSTYAHTAAHFILGGENAGIPGVLAIQDGSSILAPHILLSGTSTVDSFILGNVLLGTNTSTLAPTGFAMDGDDVYVDDLLGVGDSLYVQNNASFMNGAIRTSEFFGIYDSLSIGTSTPGLNSGALAIIGNATTPGDHAGVLTFYYGTEPGVSGADIILGNNQVGLGSLLNLGGGGAETYGTIRLADGSNTTRLLLTASTTVTSYFANSFSFQDDLAVSGELTVTNTSTIGELVMTGGITLGGVRRTTWPSGGGGSGVFSDGGGYIYPTTSSYPVAIGTAVAPSTQFHVEGDSYFTATTTFADGQLRAYHTDNGLGGEPVATFDAGFTLDGYAGVFRAMSSNENLGAAFALYDTSTTTVATMNTFPAATLSINAHRPSLYVGNTFGISGYIEVADGAATSILLDTSANSYILGDVLFGASSESITDAAFVLNGDDAYVHDLLGVGDSLYVEENIFADGNASFLDGEAAITNIPAFGTYMTLGSATGNRGFLALFGEGDSTLTQPSIYLYDSNGGVAVAKSSWFLSDDGVNFNLGGAGSPGTVFVNDENSNRTVQLAGSSSTYSYFLDGLNVGASSTPGALFYVEGDSYFTTTTEFLDGDAILTNVMVGTTQFNVLSMGSNVLGERSGAIVLSGNASNTPALIFSQTGNFTDSAVSLHITESGNAQLKLGGAADTSNGRVKLYDSSGVERINIAADTDSYALQNFIFGTTSPTYFHVSSTGFSGDDVYIEDQLLVNGTIFARNEVVIGTSSLRLSGNVTGGIIRMHDGPLTIDSSDGVLNFNTLSNQNIIFGSGNVGINSSSPKFNLAVEGTANITGNTTIGGNITVAGDSTYTGTTTFSGAMRLEGRATNPVALGQYKTTNTDGAMSVEIIDDYLYMSSIVLGGCAICDLKISILDVQDPANPVLINQIDNGENGIDVSPGVWHMERIGDVLYTLQPEYGDGSGEDFIQLIDVSDPTNPTALKKLSDGVFANLDGVNDIDVEGNYAYVTVETDDVMHIIDVSDPRNPILVSSITDATPGTLLESPMGVEVRGRYAYVASRGVGQSDDANEGLSIIDISDPANPVAVSTLADNEGGAEMIDPWEIEVEGNLAFIAAGNGDNIEIIDISDPTNPTHVGTTGEGAEDALDGVLDLEVAGNYLYTVAQYGGFSVVDVSNPANPTVVHNIEDGGGVLLVNPLHMAINSGYAYVVSVGDVVTNGSGGLQTFDIRGPQVVSADLGTARIGRLDVQNHAHFYNQVEIGGGLTVGRNGLLVRGDASFGSAVNNDQLSALTTLSFANTSLFRASVSTTETDVFIFDTVQTIDSAGTLLSINNNGVEEFSIGADGSAYIGAQSARLTVGEAGFDAQLAATTNAVSIALTGDGYDTLIETYSGDMSEGLVLHSSSVGSDAGLVYNISGDYATTQGFGSNILYLFNDREEGGAGAERTIIQTGDTISLDFTTSDIHFLDDKLVLNESGGVLQLFNNDSDEFIIGSNYLSTTTIRDIDVYLDTERLLVTTEVGGAYLDLGTDFVLSGYESYFDGGVFVGTLGTETLAHPGFTIAGNDLFVADKLGVEGNIYTDGGVYLGTSSYLSDTAGDLTIEAGNDLDIFSDGAITFLVDGSQIIFNDNVSIETGAMYVETGTYFGTGGISTESITDAGFSMTDKNDVYIDDLLGVGGTLYVENGINLSGQTISFANGVVMGGATGGAAGVIGNIAIGAEALDAATTTAIDNIAIGGYALTDNTTGSDNTAIGLTALFENTTGIENVAIARNALRNNLAGDYNIAIGAAALQDYTSGSGNIAIGVQTLGLGFGSGPGGSYNTVLGNQSVQDLEGSFNTIIGARVDVPTSTQNTIILADGEGNIALSIDVTSTLADFETYLEIDIDGAKTGSIALCKDTGAAFNDNVEIIDCSGAPTDLAEFYETQVGVEAGDIVMTTADTITYEEELFDPVTGAALPVDPSVDGAAGGVLLKDQKKKQTSVSILAKATVDSSGTVIGIVSTNPYQTLGRNLTKYAANPQPIAITGRVPVKVNLENGPIAVGDGVALSSAPGIGMRARAGDNSVGIALEAYTGGENNKIMVAIMPGEYGLLEKIDVLESQINQLYGTFGGGNPETLSVDDLGNISDTLNLAGGSILGVQSIAGFDGKWRISTEGLIISTVRTSQGDKDLYALQSERHEIVLSGSAALVDGEVDIVFDRPYMEIIDGSEPMKISVTLTDDANGVYVTNKSVIGFTVKELAGGTSDATFDWVAIVYRRADLSEEEMEEVLEEVDNTTTTEDILTPTSTPSDAPTSTESVADPPSSTPDIDTDTPSSTPPVDPPPTPEPIEDTVEEDAPPAVEDPPLVDPPSPPIVDPSPSTSTSTE